MKKAPISPGLKSLHSASQHTADRYRPQNESDQIERTTIEFGNIAADTAAGYTVSLLDRSGGYETGTQQLGVKTFPEGQVFSVGAAVVLVWREGRLTIVGGLGGSAGTVYGLTGWLATVAD